MSIGKVCGWVRVDPARALSVVQIAAILSLGVVTVFRFHIFAEVDERAHLAYVQEVAENGRIPWLGHDHVAWQELALEEHTYPRPSPLNPRLLGLRGSSYEAWQPPLYYMLAAPAFLVPNDYRNKVFAVRAFDLLLLMATILILAGLARAIFGERWRVPYCAALSVLLWPGVIVRAITVSNAALELPLVALYVLVVWSATVKPRTSSLVAAACLLGLCVLTQLTLGCLAPLLILPLVAYLRKRRDRLAFGVIVFVVAPPVVLIVPWLILNEGRYGALTASSLAQRMTRSYGPAGPQAGIGAVGLGLGRLTRVVLPQEWWSEYGGVRGVILIALPAASLLLGALPVVRHRRLLCSRISGLLAAPLALGLATLLGICLLAEWPAALFPRYLHPMLPLFAMFAAWAWMWVGISRKRLLGFVALSSLVVGMIWVQMAGAYYFTNVGAAFGIHAAPLT